MLNVLHLQTFLTVLETGSFAGAARELNYTSTAVSQQIAAIERETGVVLFDREPKRVVPTANALTLAEQVREVCDKAANLEAQMRQMGTGNRGILRLGSFPAATRSIVPRALDDFIRWRPTVEVVITEHEPYELVDAVVSGDDDVALVYAYDLVPQRWPAGLVAKEILREELILLVPSSSPVKTLKDFRASPLANGTWISSLEGSGGLRGPSRFWAIWGFQPEIVLRTNSDDLTRMLVGRGRGVGVVSRLGYSADGNVRELPVSSEIAYRRVFAIHRTRNANPFLNDLVVALANSAKAEAHRDQACGS